MECGIMVLTFHLILLGFDRAFGGKTNTKVIFFNKETAWDTEMISRLALKQTLQKVYMHLFPECI
jgi:hypothetical protein